jgi:hypothetical protein
MDGALFYMFRLLSFQILLLYNPEDLLLSGFLSHDVVLYVQAKWDRRGFYTDEAEATLEVLRTKRSFCCYNSILKFVSLIKRK